MLVSANIMKVVPSHHVCDGRVRMLPYFQTRIINGEPSISALSIASRSPMHSTTRHNNIEYDKSLCLNFDYGTQTHWVRQDISLINNHYD